METPRLVIERLVLTNFKSYAGQQIVGPFHNSFSAIVGPNGSGKSNVIDSMLFVFGFRAAKMRQSKLSELIHNSESFPDLQFCQVDIHFKRVIDQQDGTESVTVPDSELVVSRKAMRNNQSTYYINKKTSTYLEVTTMLKNEGIDLDHNRFLILQGEVESISQMKPKAENEHEDGLLEYLEDIIGTSSYKKPIETLNENIETMQRDLELVDQSFQAVSKSMNDYNEQKDLALKFLAAEKKWVDMTQQYHQFSLVVAEQDLLDNQTKLDQLNEQLGDDKKLIMELEAKLKSLYKKKDKLNLSRQQQDKSLNGVKAENKRAQQKKVQALEKGKVYKKKFTGITKELDTVAKKLRDNENDLQTATDDFDEITKELTELETKLEVEESKLNQIRLDLGSKTKPYTDKIQDLERQMDPWKTQIDQIDTEIALQESQIDMTQNDLTALIDQENRSSEALKSKKDQLAVTTTNISLIKSDIASGEAKLKDYKSKFVQAETKYRGEESAFNTLRDKVAYARLHASSIESQNKVLSGLQSLQSTGRIKGFHGRLGDLGVIDDRYDVAVSTGGGSLGDYVVDTVEDAQYCIQYLREKRLGFGKFIVLQKLRNFNMQRINTPNNIPRLFDLIEPIDAKFAPAFYSSMYDTLVANDLPTANKASQYNGRRFRVVTLNGELVDTSGTMSGGGNRVSKGAMKLKSQKSSESEFTPSIVKQLEEELNRSESEFKLSTEKFSKLQQVFGEIQQSIPSQKAQVDKLINEEHFLQTEIKDLEKKCNDVNVTLRKNDLESQVATKNKELEKLQSKRSQLQKETSGLQEEIDALNENIAQVGGLELRKQVSLVADLKGSLKLNIEKKHKDEVQIAKLKSSIEKLKKSTNSLNKDIEDINAQIKALDIESGEHDSIVKGFENQIKDLEHEIDKIDLDLTKINDNIEVVNSDLETKNSTMASFMKNIDKLIAQIEKSRQQIEHSKEGLSAITYRDVMSLITWIEDPEDEFLIPYIQRPVDFGAPRKGFDLRDYYDKCEQLKDMVLEIDANLDFLPEYGTRLKEFEKKKHLVNEARDKLVDAQNEHKELSQKRLNEFKIGFDSISASLKEMYNMITKGGVAELEYWDVHDPFQEGIGFSVMPPKKSWRNISNLSGGEKTLASLALVFALHQYKPTPLYVMDEIDAALDFKNVSIVANYIKSKTKNAQFIVISLRNNMFELSEKLVGIYKNNNMTRTVALNNYDLVH